jgi:hypothetical protein
MTVHRKAETAVIMHAIHNARIQLLAALLNNAALAFVAAAFIAPAATGNLHAGWQPVTLNPAPKIVEFPVGPDESGR